MEGVGELPGMQHGAEVARHDRYFFFVILHTMWPYGWLSLLDREEARFTNNANGAFEKMSERFDLANRERHCRRYRKRKRIEVAGHHADDTDSAGETADPLPPPAKRPRLADVLTPNPGDGVDEGDDMLVVVDV
jgi:hypothetical protein